MAINQQDQDESNSQFADGFNNPPSEATQPSEDEAFGIASEVPGDGAGEGSPPVQTTNEVTPPAEATPETAEPAAAVPSETAPEAAPPEASEEAAETPEEEAAEQDNGGEDLEAAYQASVKKIAEDFGPEFINDFITVIKYLSTQVATDGMSPLAQTVSEAIAAVNEAFQSQHFAAIKEAHEDFSEVVNSPEFAQWVQAMPEAAQEDTKKVIAAGSHREVIAMLNSFKKSLTPPSAAAGGDEFDAAMDGAEGVRSSGMSLPEEPPANDDYEKAWNQA